MENAILINILDNVVNVIQDINSNEEIAYVAEEKVIRFPAEEHIPYGFKVAIRPIRNGEDIIKYGEIIGTATKDINKGQMVHIHNVEGNRGRGDLE